MYIRGYKKTYIDMKMCTVPSLEATFGEMTGSGFSVTQSFAAMESTSSNEQAPQCVYSTKAPAIGLHRTCTLAHTVWPMVS